MAENVVTLIHNIVPYAFWNAGYRSSLARQMRVAGVETPTAEMIGPGPGGREQGDLPE
jgi:hypothetical protein